MKTELRLCRHPQKPAAITGGWIGFDAGENVERRPISVRIRQEGYELPIASFVAFAGEDTYLPLAFDRAFAEKPGKLIYAEYLDDWQWLRVDARRAGDEGKR